MKGEEWNKEGKKPETRNGARGKKKRGNSGREAEVLEESKAGRCGTYAPLCAHLVEEELK